MKQSIIFYLQSIVGMLISHFIHRPYFWIWIVVSLYIGHQINKKNYLANQSKSKSKKNE